MPIVPDYPCYCGQPWENWANCPVCGCVGAILVCSDCDGLVDGCYFCEERVETDEEQY